MPRFKNRFLLLLSWGMMLSILISIATPLPSLAKSSVSDETPPACEFQPPSVDRLPTTQVIRPIPQNNEGKTLNSNITWDNTYIGLHRWTVGQIPAIDYLVDTTVPFKNGGKVVKVFYDNQGGGYSIEIEGIGPCEGWLVYIGHLSYDASAIYKIGQEIGPDEVVGKPGISGFEAYSTTAKDGTIPPHNHYGLGYKENIFNFKDTTPSSFRGYWWIHPSRKEGQPSTPKTPEEIPVALSTESQESLNTPPEPFITDSLIGETAALPKKANLLEQFIYPVIPYRNFMIVLIAALFLVFVAGVLYSDSFRKSSLPLLALVGILLLFFFRLQNAHAALLDFKPPREASFITDLPENEAEGFVADLEEKPSPSTITASNGDCAGAGFSEKISDWCDLIEPHAIEKGFDPVLIASIVQQESAGDSLAYSGSGAVGLMQVMARDGISAGFMCPNGPCFADRPTIAQLQDPEMNIITGIKILREKVDHFGSLRDGLMHYGPDPDYLAANYGSAYYYADLVLKIYEEHR